MKKKFTVIITMETAMSYEVEAENEDEANDKAQEFIDSEKFFDTVREKCDFFSPEIYSVSTREVE